MIDEYRTLTLIVAVICLLTPVLFLAYWLKNIRIAKLHRVENVLYRRNEWKKQLELIEDDCISSNDLPSTNKTKQWTGYRELEITERKIESQDGSVLSLYLKPTGEHHKLPDFLPGQHLTLKLSHKSNAKTCYYSLSDAPNGAHYRLSVKRAKPTGKLRDFPEDVFSSSRVIHEDLKVGDKIMSLSPRGTFFLDSDDKRPVALISAGIGITPMISMLKKLLRDRDERPILFVHVTRNGDDHIFKSYLEKLRETFSNVDVQIGYSQPQENDCLGKDYQFRGRLSVDRVEEFIRLEDFQFFICGPSKMMLEMSQGLVSKGVDESAIHSEAFGPSSIQVELPDAMVMFNKSDKSALWSAEEGTLLEFIESSSVNCKSHCKAGACGQCETALVDGEVSYPAGKTTFTPKQGYCLPCVCVPNGPVTLGL